MRTRTTLVWMVVLGVIVTPSWAEETADDAQKGRRVAVLVCDPCHVIARDDTHRPTLEPPAPSFDLIAQRQDVSIESLQRFLTTTHRDAGNLRSMPDPQLIDSYAKQVASYILSLRRPQR